MQTAGQTIYPATVCTKSWCKQILITDPSVLPYVPLLSLASWWLTIFRLFPLSQSSRTILGYLRA